VFLGWLLAHEGLDARIVVASAIIIGSVIFINYARQLSSRKAEDHLVPEEIE
jgi:drug/metabolite transporter (DMT)-like permease